MNVVTNVVEFNSPVRKVADILGALLFFLMWDRHFLASHSAQTQSNTRRSSRRSELRWLIILCLVLLMFVEICTHSHAIVSFTFMRVFIESLLALYSLQLLLLQVFTIHCYLPQFTCAPMLRSSAINFMINFGVTLHLPCHTHLI